MPSLNFTLKQKNVILLDDRRIILQCNNCGQTWSPNLLEKGRLPKGYWKCPNRCNYEEKEYKHSPEIRAYFAERNRKQREKQS
jgi:hypothetical protein